MNLFKREKNKESFEDIQRKELAMKGIQSLLENGFLVEHEEVDEGLLYDGSISIRSEMFTFAQAVIEGDDEENIQKLDKFFKKNVVKEGFLPGRDGELDFIPAALIDIAAFVIGNRDLEANEPVYIDCIREGVEITCKAASPEKRTSTYAAYLMQGSLQDAIRTCVDNKNGYPLITYDDKTGELTAAILVPPLFTNRKVTRADLKSIRDAEENAFREKKIKYLNTENNI